jgi:hypothetical protein
MKRLVLILFFLASAATLLLGSISTAPAALAQTPTDACGVEGFDVPDSGPTFDFTAACQAHDACYAAGGGPLARARCDNQFLRDMNAWCTGHWAQGSADLSRCRAVALTYYAGVRLGGWLYFYG